MLPISLIELAINIFPNILEYLSPKGFRNLTSLEVLRNVNCKKVASLPKKGLPPRLRELVISDCRRLTSFSMNCLPLSLLDLDILKCPQLKNGARKNEDERGLQ